MDKIFSLNQNIENNYKLDGSFSLDSKPIVLKYTVESIKNYINFDGKLKSNNLELNNKGQYVFPTRQGEFYINGNLKNLVSLTKQMTSKSMNYFECKINFDKDNLKFNNLKLKSKRKIVNGKYENY